MSTKAHLESDTELVQADFLPHGLADCLTDAKQDSTPLVDVAAFPKAPVLVSNANQSLHSMPYLTQQLPSKVHLQPLSLHLSAQCLLTR